ncbi:hypothetical protein L211DRAFT_841332 [Terfezia boudieri ATCC MYA-4762]|uniref:Uncharacterized protein n=1 Tax=Terfezia boudieri ATCC MYA-4762 TaxID=1051890 RepID=A0A3N4LHA1_9PEZI|nr:hypothetical protein L211DRAFT_841332 [Terfezia boudieri ATCC MYA-4762]
MVARTVRAWRTSRANAQAPVSPSEEPEEEYVTTDGETPPPSSSQTSTSGVNPPRRITRTSSKPLKRNPAVVPTRSSPRLAYKVGGGGALASARQRAQMESLSELSDSPQGGWETPDATYIPSTASTPMASGRYRTPKRGSTSRRPDDMGSSRAAVAESSSRPATDRNYKSNLQFTDGDMPSGDEKLFWAPHTEPPRDYTEYRSPRGRFKKQRRADPNSNEAFFEFFSPVVAITHFFSYLIKNSFSLIRVPLIWIFFIYLAAVFTAYAGRQTTKVLVSSLTALCSIPGVTEFELLPFCKQPRPRSGDSDWLRKPPLPSAWSLFTGPQYPTPNFRQLIDLQGCYSDILEKSEMGAIAGVHLRAAHASITDLSTVVKLSNLKSKAEIVSHLKKFADGAKTASTELNRFQGRVGIEIDLLLSVNKWTLNHLKEAKKREAEIEDSKLTSGITGLILAPFRVAEMQAIQREVRDIFLRASQRVEKGLKELIGQADILINSLERLEERLIALHKAAVEADGELADDQEKILESLWSRFYHRRDLNRYEDQRKQLEDVTRYRGMARNKVLDTHQDLRNMLAHLTELRTFVSEPLLKYEDMEGGEGGKKSQSQRQKMVVGSIPLEVHIEAVTKGAKRLMQERDRGTERLREDLERAEMEENARIWDHKVKKQPERLSSPTRKKFRTETEGEGRDEERAEGMPREGDEL